MENWKNLKKIGIFIGKIGKNWKTQRKIGIFLGIIGKPKENVYIRRIFKFSFGFSNFPMFLAYPGGSSTGMNWPGGARAENRLNEGLTK